MDNLTNKRINLLFILVLAIVCINSNASFAQHSMMGGGHHHDHSQRQTVNEMSTGTCDHMKALVLNHEHEEAKNLYYETIAEQPNQPDCFFYNARLYFHHKLSGREKHARPTFDSLLVFYDQWFAASRNPNEVLNWKGRDIRDYFYKEPDSLRKYCAMYKRIYDADKESMHPFNLKMLAFCACDLNGKIDIDSLWHFTKKQAETHHDAPWKASYKSLKRELIACPKVSCAKLHTLLHPTLASGKEGSEENGKIKTLMAHRGCTGYEREAVQPIAKSDPKPLSAKVETPVQKQEPLSIAKVEEPKKEEAPKAQSKEEPSSLKVEEVAQKTLEPVQVAKEPEPAPVEVPKEEPVKESRFETFMKMGNANIGNGYLDLANKNFEEALASASSPIEKADANLALAGLAETKQEYAKAKEFAMTAHHLLPDELEAMKFISNIYKLAEEKCEFKTAKEKSAYYLVLSSVAWNLSNSEESDSWKERAELTELYRSGGAKKGEKVKVGCFINEEVTLP